MSKHKSKRGIKLTSDRRKYESDTETEEKSQKDTTHEHQSTKGQFCPDCGGKRRQHTSKETVVADTKSKDVSKEDASKDVSKNVSKDASNDASKDVSKKEVTVEAKNVSKDVPKDSSKKEVTVEVKSVSKDTPKVSSKKEVTVGVKNVSKDASKDVSNNTSKDSSKEATVGVKNVKANTGGSQPSARAWTTEQDAKILIMKSENKSWKEIAAALGASKKETQNRYRYIRGLDDDEPIEKPDNKTGEKTTTKTGLGIGELDFSGLFLDYDSGVEGGVSDNDNMFAALIDSERYYGTDKKARSEEMKTRPRYVRTDYGWIDVFSDSSNSSPPTPPPEPEYTGPRLREDAFWSANDCELLETLEGSYRNYKWLKVQAAFYNWTGRMVDAELIEKKFKDDGFN